MASYGKWAKILFWKIRTSFWRFSRFTSFSRLLPKQNLLFVEGNSYLRTEGVEVYYARVSFDAQAEREAE